ncbi:hypothetical protein M409DRAFT_51007 [Zasmidium cellare ATCC 36951]|uniref:GIY-YIG domain-containing protein n=1 Tax=Zasmidium cellare ATCC 36951 TaxID=1080233 RepID=A0A6A6CY54_ZASCE|nr:uncharacterized protein M409DRAFT_51007 [Zasmidium cellare ATCC 36951]KAF2170739.1 hypothetical protein M409DRAFT_51007 [Zasmidium cellare ATCC 36951]
MEKQLAPIPAFYACYLLRSIARHSSLYVGSTPNPQRRLKQHNGDAKGGAVRTSKISLRPWEMTCLVTGFPSKIAALQFEWAWQNPNLTRHIPPGSRITQSKMTSRISPRTGKVRKRSARPRFSLTDRLANLHLLLRSPSFARWPLKLTFFCEDVHRVWQKWSSQTPEKLRSGIQVTMDEASRNVSAAAETPGNPIGIHALDVGYSGIKQQLEKSQLAFNGDTSSPCVVCQKATPATGAATLVCTNDGCSAVSHLQCLSRVFLKEESGHDALVPTHGKCPSCKAELQWVDLVKDLSLRTRGEKEVKIIFKSKRGKKAVATAAAIAESDESGDDDDPLDLVLQEEDEWQQLSESSDDEQDHKKIRSDPSLGHGSARFKRPTTAVVFSEPVIEDSDWDQAEVLD